MSLQASACTAVRHAQQLHGGPFRRQHRSGGPRRARPGSRGRRRTGHRYRSSQDQRRRHSGHGVVGNNGIARFDLGAGRAIEENFVGDTMFGLTVLEDDRILIVGAKLHDGPDETDRDFAVLRLTEDGKADSSFAEEGVFVMDIDDGNESPVLFKLDDGGELVTEFGDEGIASAELLPAVAEADGVGLQGDSFIIAGYGRATEEEKVDMIAARFTSGGEWDTEFGEDGLVRIDISGQDDRGRDLVVLENGNIVTAGSGKPSETEINGMLVILTEDGELDETFGRDGIYQVDPGGKNDSFFSVALSEDESSAIVFGWMGRTQRREETRKGS